LPNAVRMAEDTPSCRWQASACAREMEHVSTDLLFRDDAYLKTAVAHERGIEFKRTLYLSARRRPAGQERAVRAPERREHYDHRYPQGRGTGQCTAHPRCGRLTPAARGVPDARAPPGAPLLAHAPVHGAAPVLRRHGRSDVRRDYRSRQGAPGLRHRHGAARGAVHRARHQCLDRLGCRHRNPVDHRRASGVCENNECAAAAWGSAVCSS